MLNTPLISSTGNVQDTTGAHPDAGLSSQGVAASAGMTSYNTAMQTIINQINKDNLSGALDSTSKGELENMVVQGQDAIWSANSTNPDTYQNIVEYWQTQLNNQLATDEGEGGLYSERRFIQNLSTAAPGQSQTVLTQRNYTALGTPTLK